MVSFAVLKRILSTSLVLLTLGPGASAQIKKRPKIDVGPKVAERLRVVQTRKLSLPYQARTLRDFKRTAAYRSMQGRYGNSFLQPSKTVSFPDGTKLHIRMTTNPSRAGGAVNIKERRKLVSTSQEEGWQCTTETVKLTADSTTFLNNDYGNGNARIYPGAIFKFDDFYSGNYREAAGERNGITLVTDNPNITGSSSVNVASPNVGTCRDAIATIYRRFSKDVGTESSAFDVTEANNDADLTMKISGGASGYGASFKAAYGMDKSSRSYSLTIDARKSLYSISVLPSEGGFFKDPNAGKTGNLMAVSNVVYGVRVLANMSVTFKSSKDALDFQAAYKGFGFGAEAALNYVQSHSSSVSQVHAYVVGGPGNSEVWISANQLKSGIANIMNGANYQNARPISYQFMSMAGDLIGTQSATDTFKVRQCTPIEQVVKITSARVKFVQGNDGKNKETDYELTVGTGQRGPSLLRYMTSNKSRKYEYRDNSTVTEEFDLVKGPIDANVFPAAGGGNVTLYVFRYRHKDTWKINQLTLYLNFSDGSSRQIDYANLQTKEGDAPLKLYFNAGYGAIR